MALDLDDFDSVSVAGPLSRYHALVHQGRIHGDHAQALVAERLDELHGRLGGYHPSTHQPSWRSFLKRERRREVPRGLYIHGSVGRGKSMLMDLFFAGAPVERKRRVHFHAFMAEVHQRLHVHRQVTKGQQADPLVHVAREIADQTWLLCFDEFVVNNIADAMILGRLFQTLIEAGVVIVSTSNFAPDELYKDGLQRDRFEPFIALIKREVDVIGLDGTVDYRLARLAGRPVFHAPLGPAAEAALAQAWADLTDDAECALETVEVLGRSVEVPCAAKGVARFTFELLCARPLGASDYLALASRYHTVILDKVPVLGPARHNEARRFITLIDALYESKTKLVMAAEATAEQLYPDGTGAFEFKRTVSRLMEMQSADYLAVPTRRAAA
ncbi:MAG TPA: cell division protein ZapE [Candidatus Sulfotelmatobacter sp.]|nr:cell division protein ZapE [Candidatus Sulfotelmatobacter sp.]